MNISFWVIPGLKRNLMNLNPEQRLLEIVDCVLEDTNFTFNEVKKRIRTRELVYRRQLCMYFVKQKTELSFKRIGEIFSPEPSPKSKKLIQYYDHTTVMYSIRTINNLIYSDANVRAEVESIKRKLP